MSVNADRFCEENDKDMRMVGRPYKKKGRGRRTPLHYTRRRGVLNLFPKQFVEEGVFVSSRRCRANFQRARFERPRRPIAVRAVTGPNRHDVPAK